MADRWYALQTQALKEELVARQLEARGFTAYCPQLRVRPVNPRARTLRPFFPAYLFVRADLPAVGSSVFQYLPHALGLVSFGGEPAAVEDALVLAIAERLERINASGGEPFLHLAPGDRVEIAHGPFAGYEAIFDGRLRESDRARLLLELLGGRQVAVELPVSQLRRR